MIVRTYKTAKDFEKDAKKLAKKGYVPSLQSHAAVPKGFAGRCSQLPGDCAVQLCGQIERG